MRSLRALLLIFTIYLMSAFVLHTSVAEESSDKVIRAVRIESDESPVIDGKLDDECWKKANHASGFIQFEPIPGEPPKEATKVYVLFDPEKIYVGFECLKERPDQVTGTQMKRDDYFFQDDYVAVFLDTYHDRRNCYGFSVNCLGTQVDRRIANEGSMREEGPRGDRSRAWDCSWEASAAKTYSGWTAEMAIPFSELRFDKKGDGTWGINFWRANKEFDEEDTWADLGEREYAVSRFGLLTGLTPEDFVVSRPLEIKPYVTVKPRISPEWDVDSAAGVDIRYPSPTMTADFTLNPDFAQIEADPSEINLQDVELRLAEKRPFFQEGMELFQTPIELFYTRRVGIKKLMYGAKAVGKLGNYNIALLDCQSDDTEDIEDEDDEAEEPADETKNNYFVLRTQRDVGASSSIGLLGVNKQKADGYNRMGAVDFNTALPMDMKLMGQYAGSWLPGKSDDAFIVRLDGRRKSVAFDLGLGSTGPDFEAESGFIPRTDRRGFGGSVRYEYNRDARIFRMFRGSLDYERVENHDGFKTNDRRGIDVMMRLSDFYIMMEPQWYQRVDEDDESIVHTDKTISSFAGWFPPRWASVRTRTAIGRRASKDIFFIGPEVSIIPMEKLRLEIELERLDEEGERLMLNRRFRFSYQFSHQMFFRTSLEITRDDTRSVFALYGWEYRPENHFFLVYTDDREGDRTDRIIFVKLSYLLKWNIF